MASSRDTCICEMPISSAICDWVMLRKKRSSRICARAAGSWASSGLSDSRYSTPSSASSSMPRVSSDRGRAVVGRRAGVERDGAVGVRGLQALEHLLLGDPEPDGELGDRRRAAEALRRARSVAAVSASRSSCSRRGTRTAQPLSRKCRLISPTIVGRGVRRELDPALEVEAVDRLDQADRADLDEVVERLAAAGEPAGEVLDEGQVQPDQLVARRLVLGAVGHRGDELVEELARVRPGGSPGFAHVLVGRRSSRTPGSRGRRPARRLRSVTVTALVVGSRVDLTGQRGQDGPGEGVAGRRTTAAAGAR